MDIKTAISIVGKLNRNNASIFRKKVQRLLLKKIKYHIFKFLPKRFKEKDAIVVFSEARGGSTWVMELLITSTNAISIFEPLWGKEGKFKRIAHLFSSPFYFGMDTNNTEVLLNKFIKSTLIGEEASPRTLQFNSFKSLFKSKNLVVKMVNVNLIAPWFVENFSLNTKPIFVVRHPLAILASRLNYSSVYGGSEDNIQIENFDRQRLKNSNHPYINELKYIDHCNHLYSRYLCEWCIRNRDFISGKYDEKFIVIYYEELVLEPQKVKSFLAKEAGISLNLTNNKKSSGTTSLAGKVFQNEKQIGKWISFFSDQEKKKFQIIFDDFGISKYNSTSAYPLVEQLKNNFS